MRHNGAEQKLTVYILYTVYISYFSTVLHTCKWGCSFLATNPIKKGFKFLFRKKSIFLRLNELLVHLDGKLTPHAFHPPFCRWALWPPHNTWQCCASAQKGFVFCFGEECQFSKSFKSSATYTLGGNLSISSRPLLWVLSPASRTPSLCGSFSDTSFGLVFLLRTRGLS